MAEARNSKFEEYYYRISSLSLPLDQDDLFSNQFLLEQSDDKQLSIYYAPIEYFNENAIIVIVGITPGFHQMLMAYSAAVHFTKRTKNKEKILYQAKLASSYHGQMRNNLTHMLDQLNLHYYLELTSSIELFHSKNHLIHTTGVLPYPVFYKGKNYSGSTPNMLKTDFLKKYITHYFVQDINRFQNVLLIPLGVKVENVLMYLSKSGHLLNSTIVTGFPHPSGANGHRNRQFLKNQEQMEFVIKNFFHRKI